MLQYKFWEPPPPPKKNVRTGIIIVLHNVLTGLLFKYCFRDCCMHITYSCIPPTIKNFLFFPKKYHSSPIMLPSPTSNCIVFQTFLRV